MQSGGCVGQNPPACRDGANRRRSSSEACRARASTSFRSETTSICWRYFVRSRRDRSIRDNDFLIFNQQFNTLIKAGLPILKALDLLAERAAAPALRPILADVRQRVREGALLSEALAAQGSFPPVYITVITAGERSGNLTGVLEQYIAYLRVSTGFRSRLVTALIYPAVLVATAILVVTYVVTYAMPQFADLYHELGIPLPAPTRVLLSIAAPLRSYFIAFDWRDAIAAVVHVSLDPFGPRRACHRPIQAAHCRSSGDIWVKAQIAQFVRTFPLCLAGGTPLVAALHTSAAAIGSRLISTSVDEAAERVKEGQSLHVSLAETHLVPELALEMIEVGEASGALSGHADERR